MFIKHKSCYIIKLFIDCLYNCVELHYELLNFKIYI